MSKRVLIAQRFAEDYLRRGVPVEADAVAGHDAGHLFEKGWHLGFVWDEEGGEEYLEILAQHRMTNDRHYRVWASGPFESLEAPRESMTIPHGADAAELERHTREYHEENARIYARLRERGLLPPEGANLPAHDINEHLRSGGGT